MGVDRVMLMTRDAPADATAGKIASAKVYAEGADMLIQRALPIYLEAGFTDAALASYGAKLEVLDRPHRQSRRTDSR